MIFSDDLTCTQWILLGSISFISVFYFYVKRKQSYWERQSITGPKPTFLLGNALTNFSAPVTETLANNYKKYGKLYGTYSGLQPSLVVGEPELLRHICVKDFHIIPQGFNQVYLSRVERDFLTAIWGAKWKRMRSTLSPTFSTGKMKKMFSLIKVCNQEGQQQLAKLTASGSADLDVKYFWGRYNLDVIAKCCFAANLDVYNTKDESIIRRFVEIFQPNYWKLFILITLPVWVGKMLKISQSQPENLEFLRDLTLTLVEERKKGQQKKNDFLQLLLDSEVENADSDDTGGKKLTPDEIVGASVIFLVAGYETTSTLLTWACYRIATNPDIQEKLFDEVSKADIEDYEVLSSLPYLDAVISETLRIDPPILKFQRVPHSDYVLPGTKVIVKKGTVINVPVYAIHHDPENYPDPEVFNPNRFLGDSPKPFTFLPFGAGPRTCIGMRFALINAKLSLASLIRDYQIFISNQTPSKVEIMKGSLILTAKSLLLGIKPRTQPE